MLRGDFSVLSHWNKKRSHYSTNAFFSKHKESTKEHDVHARVVARELRQQYVLPGCTVVLKTLASFITDLPYHLPSASVTSLPALVHHSLHLPAISAEVFPTFVPPSGSLSKIFLPTLVWSIPITSYGHSTLFLSIYAIPSDISNVAVILFGLFNDAFKSSQYTTSSGRIIRE